MTARITLDIDEAQLAAQVEQMSDPEQTEIVTEILSRLGAHAYQAAADYLRDNPAETERCPRCGATQFKGGPKGNECRKCRNRWEYTP